MSDLQNIKQWAEEDRPREKLINKGKAALTDAELIAILLRSGSTRESAVDLAKRILKSASDNLIELSKLSLNELLTFPGIGEAKALSIIAALELGKRRRVAEVSEKQGISSSRDVFEYFQSAHADAPYEEFWILLLNRANKILKKVMISEGGVAGTVADPKRIFKVAIENNASAMVLCHNHPSGNLKPSEADIKLTKKLKDAGALLEINIIDHVIICEERYFSFADEGVL